MLYSTHFARLAEITQVVSPQRGYVFHNRLTHSLKVAQLARTIAEIMRDGHRDCVTSLGGLDPDAAEAAGLAHDLGHPPFGHIAEHELDILVKNAGLPDGFEGNAQSFRIVSRLAVSDAVTVQPDGAVVPVAGLNLTRGTLAGIIKYPWAYKQNTDKPQKWGYYGEDIGHFDWARDSCAPFQRTLVAEIMDWADDITYAIHDVMDFYRAGMIPLEIIKKGPLGVGSTEREAFIESMFVRHPGWLASRTSYEDALDGLLDKLPFDSTHRYASSTSDDQALYQFATELITRYATAILPVPAASDSLVVILPNERRQVDVLKELIWQYVILNPEMAQLQKGQRRAIRRVFQESLEAANRNESHFFPGAFRSQITIEMSPAERTRFAADYVAGLTERELLDAYRRLSAHGAN